MDSSEKHPFQLIRGRKILSIFFLVQIIITIIITIFFYMFWPGDSSTDLWAEIISSILGFYLIVYFLNSISKRAELNIGLIVGRIPIKEEIVYYSLFAIPISFLSIGCIWLFYLPLSYITPKIVNFLLIENPIIIIWTKGPFFIFANLINFFLIVVIVPIVEEFVFRGLLISRWSKKWSAPRAILISSIIFALGHIDIVGSFFFGFIMALLYFKTNCLIIPIIVHGANNLIVWILTLVETVFYKSMGKYSLIDFQSDWWVGALCLIIGLPWGVRYIRSNWPKLSWNAPYFT